MSKSNTIELGGRRYNVKWLCSKTEQQAVNMLKSSCDESQIRNAWKQANGKSVRNYTNTKAKSTKKNK